MDRHNTWIDRQTHTLLPLHCTVLHQSILIGGSLEACKVKTACWDCLPWFLCSISVEDEDMARHHATEALEKYHAEAASDIAKFGKTHRMTQRFCCYKFQGDSVDDVPLRPMLDQSLGQAFTFCGLVFLISVLLAPDFECCPSSVSFTLRLFQ